MSTWRTFRFRSTNWGINYSGGGSNKCSSLFNGVDSGKQLSNFGCFVKRAYVLLSRTAISHAEPQRQQQFVFTHR